jgi:hypothetical protein
MIQALTRFQLPEFLNRLGSAMLPCSNRGASMDRMVFIARLLKTADGAQQLGDTSLAETAIDLIFEVLDALEFAPKNGLSQGFAGYGFPKRLLN